MDLKTKALTAIAIVLVTHIIVFLSELKIDKKDPKYIEMNRKRLIFIYAFSLTPLLLHLLLRAIAPIFNFIKFEFPINGVILSVILIIYALKLKYKTPLFIILGCITGFFMSLLWFVLYIWLLVRTHKLIKERVMMEA